MAFYGDLADYPLAELLFLLSNKNRSGWLTLQNGDMEIMFTLRNGRMVAAESNEYSQRLGQRLLANGMLTAEQLDAALVQQGLRSPKPAFGEVLIELGYVTNDDVQRTLRSQIAELLFQILIRPGGTFSFIRGLSDLRGVEVSVMIEREVLEAIRRSDEWFGQQLQVAQLRIAPQVTSDVLEEHITSDWLILEAMLDGASTLDEIVDMTGLSRNQAADAIMSLHANGILYADITAPSTAIALIAAG